MTAPEPTRSDRRHIILGTAGHIDHGKTTLVRALTGINTDRLPEERIRGISIDLGFAHFPAGEFEFHVVDVPGHEQFVRNMVAGATSFDLALLIVAADDGVMPQTREHLEIMELLGVSRGVVAITKADLVEPDLVELVRLDVADLTAGTFLEHAPVVPLCATTGAGCPELVQALVDVARQTPPRQVMPLFRLPIDRIFSVPGHGTVVTGAVLCGAVQPGDMLELLPRREPVRVRGVQLHGQSAREVGTAQRCAVNIAGTRIAGIRRGEEIATPGFLHPATRLLVGVRCLKSAPAPLKDRTTCRLHLGTAEVTARIIVKGHPVAPGDTGIAELRLEHPVVATWGQRFILRRLSPAVTIAGGTVLDPGVPPRRRVIDLQAAAQPRAAATPLERLSALFAEQDEIPASPLPAAWSVGISPDDYPALVDQLRRDGVLTALPGGDWMHQSRLAALADLMFQRMRREVVRQQPRRSLPRATLLNLCQKLASPDRLEAAWRRLVADKRLIAVGENFGPADLQIQLSKAQQALKQGVLQKIEQAGLSPPTDKELAQELTARPEALQAILTLCREEQLLVDLGTGLHYTPRMLDRARQLCVDLLSAGPATVSQLREAWGVSRKFGVPLCEYFDAQGITRRAGDVRQLGPAAGGQP